MDDLAEFFPSYGFFSDRDIRKTGEKLALAGMRTKPARYLSFSLFTSLLLSVIVSTLSMAALNFESAVVIMPISFAAIYLLMLSIPSFIAKRRARDIEADLPVALRSMATELNMGISFDRCILHCSSSHYGISRELKTALAEVENSGSGMPDALRGVSSRTDSIIVKRAVQQLIESYRHGSGAQGLKHLADELVERQKAVSREYNARIAFLGLLFVVLSCVLPALFQAYAVVGSAFLYASLSASDIWFIYVAMFPIANSLVLLAIYERTPRLLKKRKGLFSTRGTALADKALQARGIGKDFSSLLKLSLVLSLAASMALLLGSVAFSYNPLLAAVPVALLALGYFFVLRMAEKRTEEIEVRLPDALLQASSFPRGTPTEKAIRSIADSDYGPLSEEFSLAHKQISSGADVPSSLRAMADENDSVLLSRVCELLSQAYSFGGDMHRAMKETAEDMLSIFSIVRERESLLALQKYTLLFGGAVMVPLVLGSIASVVSGLETSGLEAISSTTPEQRAGLMSASVGATQAYLVIYSLLASLFISQLSGSWRSFAPYFVSMAAVALLVYNIALSTDLFALL